MKENLFFGEGFIRAFKNKIYKYMTLISKNVYINELDDIVNKYNNTYQRTIKINPIDVKSNTCINSSKKLIKKILTLKLAILLECQYINTLLRKPMFQIGLKKFLLLQKLKILFGGHLLLVILKSNSHLPKKKFLSIKTL